MEQNELIEKAKVDLRTTVSKLAETIGEEWALNVAAEVYDEWAERLEEIENEDEDEEAA